MPAARKAVFSLFRLASPAAEERTRGGDLAQKIFLEKTFSLNA
jgi:hypothetical protein